MPSENANLHQAKKAKKDEFYTQLSDIEKELGHYSDFLKGKVVFCNCDDPEESNFWKYFQLNFIHLGIKALISTHYDPMQPTYAMACTRKDSYAFPDDIGYPDKETVSSIAAVDESGKQTTLCVVKRSLKQNGDFRSNECIELLDAADVVITNPPFSLFREYVAQLMQYGKKFVIIGNKNAFTYKEIFPLIKEDKLWLGYNSPAPECFMLPDGSITKRVNGLTRWFTNVDVDKRHELMDVYREYKGHESEYPKYDNYDAINVDKISDIPCDYDGVMGVPITFLDKYNPDQFEIVSFRKGNDGKDVAYTREREREFNRTFEFLSDSEIRSNYGGQADDLLRWKKSLCQNSNPEKEPIDILYPLTTNLKNGMINDWTISGKKGYCRILIRMKKVSLA